MNGLNKVMLIGNLGHDPDTKKMDSGTTKVFFNLATTDSFKDKQGNKKEQTEWHSILMWGILADNASKILKKGSLVYIEGRLQTRSWTDKEGNKKVATEVVADEFHLLHSNGGQKKANGDEEV